MDKLLEAPAHTVWWFGGASDEPRPAGVLWSGVGRHEDHVPAIGQRVRHAIFTSFAGEVTGYRVEGDWLGVVVRLDEVPAAKALLAGEEDTWFGAEIGQ